MKMRRLNYRKRVLVFRSILIIILLSLVVLALNLNSPIIYANNNGQESFTKQLVPFDLSNHIEKLGDYINTLLKELIQPQILYKVNLYAPAEAIKQTNSTQLHHNEIILGAMTDESGNEDGNAYLVNKFNDLAGKKIGVAYFSNNWFHGIHFPLDKCLSIRSTGAVPFIRIQNWVREGDKLSDAGPYTQKNIIAGKFDAELRDYAKSAKSFGTKLLIEYGVEVNTNSFPWSQEGPGPYKAAYRHIVNLFREEGATNVGWAFHIDATDNNNGFKWYPGDDIIEWVGTTCYGDYDHKGCAGSLKDFYNRFAAISKTAKLGIFEWGYGNATDTARTLAEIPIKYPRIKLLQVWNEHVIGDPQEPYDRRINSTPQNLAAYREGIANTAYSSKYNVS
jgi:glycosyl hydrolase family 26